MSWALARSVSSGQRFRFQPRGVPRAVPAFIYRQCGPVSAPLRDAPVPRPSRCAQRVEGRSVLLDGLPVDPEPVQTRVLGMAPVRQDPQLNDLERSFRPFLKQKGRNQLTGTLGEPPATSAARAVGLAVKTQPQESLPGDRPQDRARVGAEGVRGVRFTPAGWPSGTARSSRHVR